MKDKIISVKERWFLPYMAGAKECMNHCYLGQVADNGYVSKIGVPTDLYGDYEEKK